MSENNNSAPVCVTGEERRHPAIRILARACIELARLRLAEQQTVKKPTEPENATQTVDQGQEGQDA